MNAADKILAAAGLLSFTLLVALAALALAGGAA